MSTEIWPVHGGNNYRIIKQTATGQIDKAQLALSGVAAANKSYDGSTTAILTGTARVNGLGSDDVAVRNSGTGVFADKNVGTSKDVTLRIV
ncbi:YDG domain-containing protein [Xanthomonas theicola]|uniref:YDG domain-containing protein n=1 Tax=Xanthomonas theicola TaxID=56464 RepID=A0A2S6YYS3_9XANT|nr:YDG domain-containing protein [Xanthomonas theicola]PPT72887.1 hypothetical protein XthCFBP4691_20670 [Xanthomonas theicola]QNH23537.1 hypothetical protein G4Q83_00265 [Xanthomonas theicola]